MINSFCYSRFKDMFRSSICSLKLSQYNTTYPRTQSYPPSPERVLMATQHFKARAPELRTTPGLDGVSCCRCRMAVVPHDSAADHLSNSHAWRAGARNHNGGGGSGGYCHVERSVAGGGIQSPTHSPLPRRRLQDVSCRSQPPVTCS